jgi:hypothetical protein
MERRCRTTRRRDIDIIETAMSVAPLRGLLLSFVLLASCKDANVPDDTTPPALSVIGFGSATDRYTAELWVRGNVAYTTSWSTRGGIPGNAIKIWDVSGSTPVIVDSVIVQNAGTLGDIQVTEDGQYLVVAIEPSPNGAMAIFSLADPRRPVLVTRFQTAATTRGVHTAEVQVVGGTLYAFLAVNSGSGTSGNLAIVSLANPALPVVVNTSITGVPFVHDVFVRSGMLFVARWNGGMSIYDIGGGSSGGSPSNPAFVSNIVTAGGQVHNIWWYHDASGNRRYAFVGQEGPASLFNTSSGDIHVVDISNMSQPREVAFYSQTGAGTHNFSVDEQRGVLYAAYYNAGVRALDVRGDLSSCTTAQKSPDGRCNLGLMGREIGSTARSEVRPSYVWGVHYVNGRVYASDMLTGLWVFTPAVPSNP